MLDSEVDKLNKLLAVSVGVSLHQPLFCKIYGMKPRFKAPRLVIPSPESKDQRWVIKFWVYDAEKKKQVLVRDVGFNHIKDLKKRRHVAERLMAQYLEELKSGAHINRSLSAKQDSEQNAVKEKKEKESLKSQISLVDAVNSVVARKSSKSESTKRDYAYFVRYLFEWLKDNGKANIRLSEFDLELAREYMHHFLTTRKASPRYHNNAKTYLGTIFRELEMNGYPIENPFKHIPKLKEGRGRNHAYDKAQQNAIMELAAKQLPALIPVLKTMYYTLMREAELIRLQVKDIYALHPNRIYLPGSKSKNSQERHIEVPEELAKVFEEMKVKEFPDDYYVFSDNTLTPGPKMYTVKKLGARYSINIGLKLKYGPNYTLYSWKHTGVAEAKLAGIDDAYIMMQGGWLDVGAYNKYLKSLALMENTEFRNKMPKLGEGRIKNR